MNYYMKRAKPSKYLVFTVINIVINVSSVSFANCYKAISDDIQKGIYNVASAAMTISPLGNALRYVGVQSYFFPLQENH